MKQQRTFTTGGNEYQVAIEIDENSLIDQTMNELNEAINYYTEQGHAYACRYMIDGQMND